MSSEDALPPLADPTVRRVALVRLRVGLGDWLCSEPALRLLRHARPDLHVTVVTWPDLAEVVRRTAHADDLLAFPGHPGIPERRDHRAGTEPDAGPDDAWERFVAAARERRFDLAVQCYGDNPAANAVTAALGARRVAGFAPAGWDAVRDPDLHLAYPRDLHEVWRHLRLVELLGVPLPPQADPHAGLPRHLAARPMHLTLGDGDGTGTPFPVPLHLPLGQDDEAEVAALLAQHELEPGRYAVLHPGASSPSRRWPPDRFAQVADHLAADGLRVVLTGGQRERALTAAVAAAARAPVVDLAGATSLGGLAALLASAALAVCNDTGTAHLAAAVGTPSVTLFLPGDPVRWRYPSRLHPSVRVDVGCNPCPHLECPIDHRCASAVTVPAVLDAARAALRSARRSALRSPQGASRRTATGGPAR